MAFGWIDFSKEERNKVIATLKKLEVGGTVDELGIGVIRDAFSNLLFPCVSVLQTRAKYFVLIPQLLKDAEKDNRLNTPSKIVDFIHQKEESFAEQFRNESELGVIGKMGEVKYKPSQLYWNGLRSLEIIPSQRLSFQQLCTMLARKKQRKTEISIKQGHDDYDDDTVKHSKDDILYIPPVLDIDQTSMNLTYDEANFIFEKASRSAHTKNALFTFLIEYFSKQVVRCDTFDDLPVDVMPDHMKSIYIKARDFSNFLYGAHIRFNYLYAKVKNSKEDADIQEAKYHDWHQQFDWSYNFSDNIAGITTNNRNRVFDFLEDFYHYAKHGFFVELDDLIIKRERTIKGDRAKLKHAEIDVTQPVLHFNPIHDFKLDFRFNTARVIINDIVNGLRRDNDA